MTDAEKAVLKLRMARAKPLLSALSQYGAELHYECEVCGCVLWCRVIGGWRCVHCWPPVEMSEELRKAVAEAL